MRGSLNVRFTPKSDRIAASPRNVAMGQSLHFALQEKQRPSRRQTTMKSATDLPNGDPQHLREATLRSV
jgi:hypothetical protein